MLEEAGAADLLTVLQTLHAQYPNLDETQLLGEASDGMRRLWLAGLIELSVYHDRPAHVWVPLRTLQTEQVWTTLFTLEYNAARWHWPDNTTLPLSDVVLTEAGRHSLTT